MDRRVTVAVVFAALVATSGCLGFLSGPITFSASKATVGDDALQQTEYEEAAVNSSEVTRTFSAAGQSKNVTVTNWVAMYERTVDVPVLGERRAAVFGAFASPEVSVLGQTFNPIKDYSDRELASLAQQQYSGLSIGDSVGTREVGTLNQTADVTKFEGTATLSGGQSVDVYVHVTKVKHDGDFVVAVAIYPQRLDGEQEKVDALLSGLEH
ncbi:DUF6517 family protein [Halobacterium litoreum]|uniref:DUF6517 family protein n=1 Tax=Halobacterium litoreum TaxID=2039234 RepID=A0ABD5NBF0_9EURY|nr:DUF6517 family protein [Halobacterium litoreum]UHH14692.1 DUF6517 family protein [Halobacterium litoreum]